MAHTLTAFSRPSEPSSCIILGDSGRDASPMDGAPCVSKDRDVGGYLVLWKLKKPRGRNEEFGVLIDDCASGALRIFCN